MADSWVARDVISVRDELDVLGVRLRLLHERAREDRGRGHGESQEAAHFVMEESLDEEEQMPK